MTEKELLDLISQGESQNIEFTVKPDPEMGKSIVAFANTNDGALIIGVSDDKTLRGCSMKDEQSMTNTAHDCKPSIYPEIEKIEIDGKLIFVVKVRRSGSGVDYAYKNVVYKRVGTHDKPMSPKEVVDFAISSGVIQFDSQICKEAVLEDLSKKKVNWYLKKKLEIRKTKKPRDLSYEDLLVNIKAALKTPKGIIPTNAGVLFFAKYPQKFYSQSKLRVVKFKGNEVINPTHDRYDGANTLWAMVEEAEEFIRKNIRLLGFRTEKSFRREDKFEYPIKALREAIINAIIHRNYFESEDTRVFIFDDRVEVINPGTFPPDITPEHPKHKAINPILCDLMYDIGFIEKYGSGIYMMKQLCKESENKEPLYELHPVETKIIFESPVKESTYIEIKKEEVNLKELGLNERQIKAMKYLKTKGAITNKEHQNLNTVSQLTASRDLSNLVKKDLLEQKGFGRGSKFILKGK